MFRFVNSVVVFTCLTFFLCVGNRVSAQSVSGPPPPNDSIGSAIDLGTLPLAPPCPTGDSGSSVTVSGTTAFATWDSRFAASGGCFSGTSPDVWYRFKAVSNYTSIKFTATSPSPQFDTCFVRIWMSNGLNSSILQQLPLNCLTTDDGTIDQEVLTTANGGEYFIEIGGQHWDDTGSFVLEINAELDCDDCVRRAKVHMLPEPMFGIYGLGQNVVMCATISEWNYTSSSLPQYIGPAQLGTDWDLGSLTQLIAPGLGWSWMDPTSNSNVQLVGYYYDPDGDLNPTNNAGDPSIAPFVNRTGCWSVKTNNSCNTGDLSVLVKVYSDDEVGNGNQSNTCDSGDQNFIDLHNQCCVAPLVTFVSPTCILPTSGLITLGNGLASGNDSVKFVLYNQLLNSVLASETNTTGNHTFTQLTSGSYVVECIQYGIGACTTYVSVHLSSIIDIQLTQISASCSSGGGAVVVDVTGPSTNYTVQWSVNSTVVSTNDTATSLPNGWVTCTVVDATINCTLTDSIFIVSQTPTTVGFSYTNNHVCSGAATVQLVQQPNLTGGTYTLQSPQSSGIQVNQTNGQITLASSTATPPYNVVVKYTVTDPVTGCIVDAFDSIKVVQQPPAPVLSTVTPVSVCVGAAVPLLTVQQTSSFGVMWLDQQTSIVTYSSQYLPAISTSQPGSYSFVVALTTDPLIGCLGSTLSFAVNVNAPPTIQVTSDTTLCPGDTLIAQVTTTVSNIDILWVPTPESGNPNVSIVSLSPSVNTTYQVTVTEQATACSTNASLLVSLDTAVCSSVGTIENFEMYSGITPNGDGLNDEWIIDGINGIQGVKVQIVNRWGVVIWSTNDYNNTTNVWRGTSSGGEALSDGTYFYIVRYNGVSKKGWIELNR